MLPVPSHTARQALSRSFMVAGDGWAGPSTAASQNRLSELWALLCFLMPSVFRSEREFADMFERAPTLMASAGPPHLHSSHRKRSEHGHGV